MEIPSKATKTKGLKGILSSKTVKDGIVAQILNIVELLKRYCTSTLGIQEHAVLKEIVDFSFG